MITKHNRIIMSNAAPPTAPAIIGMGNSLSDSELLPVEIPI